MSALTILLEEDNASKPHPELAYKALQKSFTCPASGAVLTDAQCVLSRKANPAVCANCLIPLADDKGAVCMECPAAPAYTACAHCETRPTCRKCGGTFAIQEAAVGFTTCEHCGEGDAA